MIETNECIRRAKALNKNAINTKLQKICIKRNLHKHCRINLANSLN